MSTAAPLDGLLVVDLADEKGELCGRLLADLGADVVRVEPPRGARSRRLPPFVGETSLYFSYRNFNKRSAVLDLSRAQDRERLHALLARADVLVESHRPDELAAVGLDPGALAEGYPQLIVTSISDFGHTGPYRDYVATDAVLEAMSGMLFKAGLPEKAPLNPPGPLAYDVAGIVGALATLFAVYQRHSTGWGQHIDLSVMEAVAQTTDWSFANASVVRAAGGQLVELRAGSGPIYTIYPCKDGFVRLIILSPRQWHAMRAWLGEPEELQDPHWDGFIARLGIAADILNPMFAKLFANLNMVEVSVEAQRRGIVCTPVLKPEEVTTNEHLVSRGTFVDAEVAADVRGPVASGFFQFEGERQGYRAPAPALGEHSEAVFADSGPPRPTPGGAAPTPALPLEGIRVLDFGIGGVGVEAARLLGEYGADVIKVETRTYPDFIRVITGSEMSASFASSSRSKRGFGVNVKTEAGLAVLQRLVEHADVIIENASTGTMDDMGVGYTTIQKLNPRCIMVSSQLLGSRGVWADWIGYGPSTQPLGGMVHLWNYDDQESPAGSTSIFPDHLAGRLCAAAAVAGLIRRERTGTGGHAEVAQIEAVTGLLGDLLLKAAIEPGSVGPRGNKSDRGAPWGPYPCAGTQQWCAVSVRNDGDWRALQQAMGAPEWAADERLATTEGRLANRDALDARFSEWTLQQDKHDLTALLQARGIPAGPMLTGGEQIDDPHLVARGYPRALEQQDQGPMLFEGPSFRATGMADIQLFQAPRLGEHTRDICRELLGMADAEIDSLLSSGALEGPPESS